MRKIFAALLPLILCVSAYDQKTNKDIFDEFLEKSSSEFESFRDRNNRQYAEFLLSNWEQFHASEPIPKPVIKPFPPVVYTDTVHHETSKFYICDAFYFAKDLISRGKKAGSTLIASQKTDFWEHQFRDCDFSCFGREMKVRVPNGKEFKLQSVSPSDLSKAWKELSKPRYECILEDCTALKKEHNMCDWAYLKMLKTFSDSYLSESPESTFLTAYIYTQSGYKMRLGLDGQTLYFLFGTDYTLYDVPYYNIDGTKYYIYGSDADYMSIANITYPEEADLSLLFSDDQKFGIELAPERTITSERLGVISHCSVNREKIKFYDSYPAAQLGDDYMTRWALAAKIPLGEEVTRLLYPELRKKIEGKGLAEATDILLDFVQTGLTYKVDDEVWGEDRVFYADETLYYPYCDCEDRSILFSILVRDLLGLEVALVYYPNHLAAAVKLPEDTEGDAIQLPTGRFVICDASYIGANIGMTIPGMDNSTASIIVL